MIHYTISYLFLCFLFCYSGQLYAQHRPSFLQEDVEENPVTFPSLIQPGVKNKTRGRGLELSYQLSPRTAFNAENGYPLTGPESLFRLHSINFKLRFPIINQNGLKILGGLLYRPETYNFSQIGPDFNEVFSGFDQVDLKSSGFEALILKPLNDRHYFALQLRAVYNGNYDGLVSIDDTYGVYGASAIFGIKKSEDKEWGIGLNLSSSFRTTSILPFLLYNHTFSDKWGIETVLPALVSIRYNCTDRSIFLAGLRYNSRSYALNDMESTNELFHLNHSEIRATISLEHALTRWIWLEAATGYQHNFSTDFEAVNTPDSSFEVEPGSSPFFRLGIFVSPPRE